MSLEPVSEVKQGRSTPPWINGNALVTSSLLIHLTGEVYTAFVTAHQLVQADMQMFALAITGAGIGLSDMQAEEFLEIPLVEPSTLLEPQPVPLDRMLDKCFKSCLKPSSDRGSSQQLSVCEQLTRLIGPLSCDGQDCCSVCPLTAVVEAKELCLGQGCDPASCGVGSTAELTASRHFKVEARLVLRGKFMGNVGWV